MKIIHLSTVESTNNYIAEHDDIGTMADGTVIVADTQTAGKGQRGRVWEMAAGKDLAMSMLVRPKGLTHSEAFILNKGVALAVRDAIRSMVPSQVSIKWPNDIYIGDEKVAGMLIEMSWQGVNCQQVICGIGVNLASQRQKGDFPAISVKEAGGECQPMEGAMHIAKAIAHRRSQIWSGQKKIILDDYKNHLYRRGKWERFKNGEDVFSGRIEDVDSSGRLLIEGENGMVRAYEHGEVEMIKKERPTSH